MPDDRPASPAFQFYPKDFLSDEKQVRMSLAAVGIYMRLICHCWNEGSLPADLVSLARLSGATKRQITELWPSIGICFRETAEGRLIHPRLEREREKQATYRQRQSDKGKASAHMRAVLATHRATTVEPRLNHGSPPVDVRLQPKSNSSSSSAFAKTVAKEQLQVPAVPSPAKEFLGWFQGEYKARRHGAVYFVSWEKHMPIVGRLLKLHAPDRLKKHAQILLTTDEDWTETTDRGIEVLAGKINWLEERLCAWEAKKRANG